MEEEEMVAVTFGHHQSSWVGLSTRRNPGVRAEGRFVDAKEAKNLAAGEGYAILDNRYKSQFDRAHIKSCCHVPLFIKNQDNDFGNSSLSSCIVQGRDVLVAGLRICSLNVKRAVHYNFTGLFFGEPFIRTQFPPERKLLIVYQRGLRSAAAAQKLETAGFQKHAREDLCRSRDNAFTCITFCSILSGPSREAASVGPHQAKADSSDQFRKTTLSKGVCEM